MDTLTEIEFLLDVESPVCCEEKNCDNEATWIRRHDSCRRLVCSECKEYIESQLLLCDEDDVFWCSVCDVSEPLQYWWENIKWLRL